MRYKITLIFFWAIMLFAFFTCKKPASPEIYNNPQSFSQVFDDFWNEMNTNYVYWDIDTTNWDNVYKKYKPIFASLDIKIQADFQISVNYFRQITDGLVDSHYSINFESPIISGSYIDPALDRKVKEKNFHVAFPYTSIDSNYLDSGFLKGTYITSDNLRLSTICGTVNKNILYFSCNNFALKEAYTNDENNTVKSSLLYFFGQVQNSPAVIKAIIIDVRNNPGGNLEDLNFLMGHFIGTPLQFGYSRYKTGNGRLDYTPWINTYITPQEGYKTLSVPVMVLADNFTISLAEAVAMAVHILPTGIVIGENTWGATGPITDNALYNDGPFTVPGFLNVTEASGEFKYINGKRYEGVGFPPDIPMAFNLSELNSGHDLILEKAISLIH